MDKPHCDIRIQVATNYVDDQSEPDSDRYVFAYTITISNSGSVAAQLISRHWIITDANGKVQEVNGDGVVGEQPYLSPGEEFRYSSGAVLRHLSALCRVSIAWKPTAASHLMQR